MYVVLRVSLSNEDFKTDCDGSIGWFGGMVCDSQGQRRCMIRPLSSIMVTLSVRYPDSMISPLTISEESTAEATSK
jgi:hypothetical protein